MQILSVTLNKNLLKLNCLRFKSIAWYFYRYHFEHILREAIRSIMSYIAEKDSKIKKLVKITRDKSPAERRIIGKPRE